LGEIDGIVSVASFETLVQWLYRGAVTFPNGLTITHEITKIIEFVRLADMCDVTGMEEIMAEHIKMLLRKPPPPSPYEQDAALDATRNRGTSLNPYVSPFGNSYGSAPASLPPYTRHILPEHLYAVSELPESHPVRMVLAAALVSDYLRPDFKFQAELSTIQTLAYDILVATKAAIGKQQPLNLDGHTSYSARASYPLIDRHITYRDPITEKPTGYGECEDCGWRGGGYDVDLHLDYQRSLGRVRDARDRAINRLSRGSRQ
jgi:hypothetical protein